MAGLSGTPNCAIDVTRSSLSLVSHTCMALEDKNDFRLNGELIHSLQ